MQLEKKNCRATCISGRRFDDGVSRLNPAFFLSILHHPQTNTIFNRASGVEIFAFSHCKYVYENYAMTKTFILNFQPI